MIRRPPDLPDSEWEETFVVLEVKDAFKHDTRGRTLEFLTADQQFRTVAILDLELNAGTIRRLQRDGISYR